MRDLLIDLDRQEAKMATFVLIQVTNGLSQILRLMRPCAGQCVKGFQ